jgi:hypothetical protein
MRALAAFKRGNKTGFDSRFSVFGTRTKVFFKDGKLPGGIGKPPRVFAVSALTSSRAGPAGIARKTNLPDSSVVA